jgi:hypothetical protein
MTQLSVKEQQTNDNELVFEEVFQFESILNLN